MSGMELLALAGAATTAVSTFAGANAQQIGRAHV